MPEYQQTRKPEYQKAGTDLGCYLLGDEVLPSGRPPLPFGRRNATFWETSRYLLGDEVLPFGRRTFLPKSRFSLYGEPFLGPFFRPRQIDIYLDNSNIRAQAREFLLLLLSGYENYP